jgi:F-type H+-transporting ATPase subunit delta
LYDLATEAKSQAAVETELIKFQALLDGSEDLRRMVKSPVIAADDQNRALATVLDRAGIQGLAGSFLKLIARNRRLFMAEDMIRSYRAIAAKARGEVTAEAVSAVPLSDAQALDLAQTLANSVGQVVRLTQRIDPGLLGGLVVKIGSRMIDSSIRTKLNSLKTRMKEAN